LEDATWQATRQREFALDGEQVLDPDGALLALTHLVEARRGLAALRGGDCGTLALNAAVHRLVASSWRGDFVPAFLPGEPVVVTRNDRSLGVHNGDSGVIARLRDEDGQRFYVVFARPTGLQAVRVDRLREHLEVAWVTTVHKAQGSEFDRIALVLPERPSPVITRALIYTALTRARHSARLITTGKAWDKAVAEVALRDSGLRQLLSEGAS
jgi:exodeoxyribonuclease V alpha subunit